VSSSVPTKLLVLAAVVLGGCMKIYPDPELPDIVVTWDEFYCTEGTEEVRIAVYPFDSTDALGDTTVPCSALSVRFDDVARARYRVEGELHADGEVYNTVGVEADLHDGVNKRVYAYFDTFSNIRVEWTFENGASCASLGTPWVAIDAAYMDEPTFDFTNVLPCELSAFQTHLAEDRFRIRVRARSNTATVAVAPIEEVVLGQGLTDLAVVLAPCGADCPE
jgi:hypothetical protein